MDSDEITVTLSRSTWREVTVAMDARLAVLYRRRTEAIEQNPDDSRARSFAVQAVDVALIPLNVASIVIEHAMEPVEDEPDGIDEAKRERDIAESVA